MHHVRGNHDALTDPELAVEGAPYVVELDGVSLAVLDSTIPGTDAGRARPAARRSGTRRRPEQARRRPQATGTRRSHRHPGHVESRPQARNVVRQLPKACNKRRRAMAQERPRARLPRLRSSSNESSR